MKNVLTSLVPLLASFALWIIRRWLVRRRALIVVPTPEDISSYGRGSKKGSGQVSGP